MAGHFFINRFFQNFIEIPKILLTMYEKANKIPVFMNKFRRGVLK